MQPPALVHVGLIDVMFIHFAVNYRLGYVGLF